MTGSPRLVGGPGRDVTVFMEGVPGLMAKDGAEGVYAAAMPEISANCTACHSPNAIFAWAGA